MLADNNYPFVVIENGLELGEDRVSFCSVLESLFGFFRLVVAEWKFDESDFFYLVVD